MKFGNIDESYNKLMKRKDLNIEIDYETRSTPSKAELQLAIAKHFSVDPEKVSINQILTINGISKGTAIAKVWDDKKFELYGKKKEEKKE